MQIIVWKVENLLVLSQPMKNHFKVPKVFKAANKLNTYLIASPLVSKPSEKTIYSIYIDILAMAIQLLMLD